MQKRSIEVCLTPALLHLHDLSQSVVVVIDIFRATSAICYGIDNGAEAIIPVASIEACESYRHSDFLLAAERNGEVVSGFDFGNSPFSYVREKIEGKTVVLTTTNGTHAINVSRGARDIVIGSFLNLSALCSWLQGREDNVILLCSGWKDKVNLEDTLFAGAVIHCLRDEGGYEFDDAGVASEDLYVLAKKDLRTYLRKSSHTERLERLGIEDDVVFCLQTDIAGSVPILDGDRLIKYRG